MESPEITEKLLNLESDMMFDDDCRSEFQQTFYRFPEIQVKGSWKNQTPQVAEEAAELMEAIASGESCDRIVEEALDVIHAAETLIRMMESQESVDIEKQWRFVLFKNLARGYYDELS